MIQVYHMAWQKKLAVCFKNSCSELSVAQRSVVQVWMEEEDVCLCKDSTIKLLGLYIYIYIYSYNKLV